MRIDGIQYEVAQTRAATTEPLQIRPELEPHSADAPCGHPYRVRFAVPGPLLTGQPLNRQSRTPRRPHPSRCFLKQARARRHISSDKTWPVPGSIKWLNWVAAPAFS